jgi:homoserine dehydrogenase
MAQKLGLTEPGTINPIQLINREINDVQLKTTILLNLLNKDSLAILPSQIKIQRIDQQQLTKLIEIRNIRLIVSIEKRGNHWQATISFQKLTPSSSLLVPGVNNALIINQKYGICGPGAGPVPTVRVMIEDAIHLCPN